MQRPDLEINLYYNEDDDNHPYRPEHIRGNRGHADDHKSKGKRQKKGIFHPAISHLTPWYQRFKKYLTGDPRHKR